MNTEIKGCEGAVGMKSQHRDGILLKKLKRWPSIARKWNGHNVRIWSGEWQLWWRPNGSGYTHVLEESGIFKFEWAVKISAHCGPEKQIEYVLAKSP